MRLQLTLPLLLVGAPAVADDTVKTRVDVYDDAWITVVMPAVSVDVDREKFQISGGGILDQVSGATRALPTDTVSSATHFDDLRYAGNVAVKLKPKTTWSIGGHLAGGREQDFSSVNGGLSGTFDAAARRVTFGWGASAGRETAWRSDGGDLRATSWNAQLDLSSAVVVDRNTRLTVRLTGRTEQCSEVLGCQASPYRYVALGTSGAAVPERHPDTRWRGAASLELARALGDHVALHASYRFYADSWHVTGHTGQVGVAGDAFRDRLGLRGDLRVGWQGAAAFFQDNYATPALDPTFTAWRSADPELSGLLDVLLKGSASWTFFEVGRLLALTIDARVAGTWFRYPQLTELPRRDGVLVGGGLGARF